MLVIFFCPPKMIPIPPMRFLQATLARPTWTRSECVLLQLAWKLWGLHRRVFLKSKDEKFTAFGKSCILRGPLTYRSRKGGERRTNLDCCNFRYCSSSSSWNTSYYKPDKIGDARKVNYDNCTCKFRFEDAGLEPTEIKFNNFIVFELPPLQSRG